MCPAPPPPPKETKTGLWLWLNTYIYCACNSHQYIICLWVYLFMFIILMIICMKWSPYCCACLFVLICMYWFPYYYAYLFLLPWSYIWIGSLLMSMHICLCFHEHIFELVPLCCPCLSVYIYKFLGSYMWSSSPLLSIHLLVPVAMHDLIIAHCFLCVYIGFCIAWVYLYHIFTDMVVCLKRMDALHWIRTYLCIDSLIFMILHVWPLIAMLIRILLG